MKAILLAIQRTATKAKLYGWQQARD